MSGESPSHSRDSSFLNSECDYGIGHEPIAEQNYVYMPHWYQSIDWSFQGFPRIDSAFYRLGKPIQVDELTTGIPASKFRQRNKRCAFIASHMTPPRDVMIYQIGKLEMITITIFIIFLSQHKLLQRGS